GRDDAVERDGGGGPVPGGGGGPGDRGAEGRGEQQGTEKAERSVVRSYTAFSHNRVPSVRSCAQRGLDHPLASLVEQSRPWRKSSRGTAPGPSTAMHSG